MFETIVRSIPSMGHILILLGLFVYVYGVVGFQLYSGVDPDHWGSLGAAILTLFQVLTLEGWHEIHAVVSETHPWSWLFFTSFIVIAVGVVTSLFVAVIVNNLAGAKQAAAQRADIEVPGNALGQIAEIRQALTRLERNLRVHGEEPGDS